MKVKTKKKTVSAIKKLTSVIRHVVLIFSLLFMTVQVKAQSHETDFTFTENVVSDAVRQSMQRNAKAVFVTVNKSFGTKQTGLTLSTTNATPEAIEQIQSLWSTSRFYCTETELIARVLRSAKGWQVRSIPVLFEEADSDRDKYQEMVIEFTSEGKISDLYPAMPMNQYYSMIQAQDTVVELRRRLMVAKFVEDFRVAHFKRDINYLESVYSDDALIIKGKILERSGDGMQPVVVYETLSKKEYIENLKRVFARNSYLNVKFEELIVVKDERNPNVFGVTMKQNWTSTTYSDQGWLFLMIDFKDEEKPQIWVRTWQPLEVPRSRVYSLIHFPRR